MIKQLTQKASLAARQLALATTEDKNRLLAILAASLKEMSQDILAANKADTAEAEAAGTPPHMIDRLALNAKRLDELAAAVGQVASLADPVGEITETRKLENGLTVSRLRIPLGLIAFICEARPGALVEAGALCIKSGNGLIVKCGKEMARTAEALSQAFAKAFAALNLPAEAITVLPR